jgi:hypothetical protein
MTSIRMKTKFYGPEAASLFSELSYNWSGLLYKKPTVYKYKAISNTRNGAYLY